MVQTIGGEVFLFSLHDTTFDVAAGKPVTATRDVVIVSSGFFEASRIAENWVQCLEAGDSMVDPRTLRLANIEDVYWPFHSRKREWASLAAFEMQLFKCTYAELVPMVRKPSNFKEELHNVLVAAPSLGEASKVMNQIMEKVAAPTKAKYVKRTKIEAVLTSADGAVERVEGAVGMEEDLDATAEQDAEDVEDLEDVEDIGDVEVAQGSGDVAMLPALEPPPPAVLADALQFAIEEAPLGGPKASVTTLEVGDAAIPLPQQPSLSVIEEGNEDEEMESVRD